MSESVIENRYDFIIIYDVENGNPNGDPDADNLPRLDVETGFGIVTDVCIKRKIRNYIDLIKNDEEGFSIYIKQDIDLDQQDKLGVEEVKHIKEKKEKSLGFRSFMCKHFFDIRAFGAVMVTAAKDKELSNSAGQVRGPIQLTFGRSIDPIVPQEITITRVAMANEERSAKSSTEMGRKHIIPYAVYRQEGFISANLAKKVTGFSQDDLEIFWKAILHMFDEDRSAARGKMTLRELIVFKHDSSLGNAPSQNLFDLVKISKKDDIVIPRKYDDYNLVIDYDVVPNGVTIERKTQF